MSFSSYESSSSSHVLEQIGVGISEYICVGDDAVYDFHVFTVRIWNEREKLHYSVQRSYSSFCDFHIKLTRKFTRTKLPPLPLADFPRYLRRAEKLLEQNKLLALAPMLKSATASDSRIKRRDASEVLSQKKTVLSAYLQELLGLPEVLMSEELALFLDEESTDGLALLVDDLSAIEISLLAEEPVSKSIAPSRCHELIVPADQGCIIVWRFHTKSKDIGFSVEFSGESVVPYQRYNSHTNSVSGMVSMPCKGAARLVWDNTYSKLRSKALTYRVRVVGPEEFDTAGRIAEEKIKGRQRLNQQRLLLKRVFASVFKHLVAAKGSARASITINDQRAVASERLAAIYQDMEETLQAMKQEKIELMQQAASLETALEDERADNKQLSENWEAAEVQRQELHSELAAARRDLEMERKARRGLELTSSEEIANYKSKLTGMESELSAVEAQYLKAKADKKQLKAYALQMKAEAGAWAAEKSQLLLLITTRLAEEEKEKAAAPSSSATPNQQEGCVEGVGTREAALHDARRDLFPTKPSPSWRALLSLDPSSNTELVNSTNSTSPRAYKPPPGHAPLSSAQKLLLVHSPVGF